MIAFTICSNNYLQKARVLINSIKQNEDVKVYLFLADQKSDLIDYDELAFDKVILPDELNISNLQWQLENYNIVEFNTAIKAAAFQYLFNHTKATVLYYFDTDIKLYQKLSKFDIFWKDSSIFLTPHILKPVPFDGKFPGENLFLNHGTYNLGFLGLRKTETALHFLNWWSERLAHKCIINLKEGYFTDQIWFNLVPLLFKDVTISSHPGLNAAYWNLHDRRIDHDGKRFMVNHQEELYFYHFSSFDEKLEKLMPRVDARYSFENRPEMITLYKDYWEDLLKFSSTKYLENYYADLYPLKIEQPSIFQRIYTRLKKEFIIKNNKV